MGQNLSRPQYSYREPRRPAEYFRVCDPEDCFCGQPHFRQRHVAVHRLPGGLESYQDASDAFGAYLSGYGCGCCSPGMESYGLMQHPSLSSLGHPYAHPGMSAGLLGPVGGIHGLGDGFGGVLQHAGPGGHGGWPGEWKDPREWTVRDFDRLGEVMDEYLSRQRGRGMGDGMPGYMSSYKATQAADIPWNSAPHHHHQTARQSHSELDQMREQIFRYAQEAREHVQSMSDCLYGSEREHREERYKERQRKMIEEILRNLAGSGRPPDGPMLGGQPNPPAGPGAGYPSMPGMHGMMGAPPGFMMPGQGMAGMPPMFPYGFDPMAQYGGMAGMPAHGMPRPRRGMRNLGFGDALEDDPISRRNRRNRRGFEELDDDMMDMGDGPRSPRFPRRPQRPGPGRGGGGATFDDGKVPDREYSARPTYGGNDDRWAVYEPTSATQTHPQHDNRPSAEQSGPGHEPGGNAEQYNQLPPRFDREAQSTRAEGHYRSHVRFNGEEEEAGARSG